MTDIHPESKLNSPDDPKLSLDLSERALPSLMFYGAKGSGKSCLLGAIYGPNKAPLTSPEPEQIHSGDAEGEYEGDYEGEYTGDYEGEYTGDYEGERSDEYEVEDEGAELTGEGPTLRVISDGEATHYLAGIQSMIEAGERPRKTPIADYVSLGGLPRYDVRLISDEYNLKLSLYDLPGELFSAHAISDNDEVSAEALALLRHAISGCVGFVYILPYEDPALIRSARGQEWEPAPIPHVLLTHLQELHKSERHPIPVACVLTKADLSPEIANASSAEEAHQLARQYMRANYTKIVDTLDSLSSRVEYFATSAFGRARADKVTPDQGAQPRWVLDPIDWLCLSAMDAREELILTMFGSRAWSIDEQIEEFRLLMHMTMRYDRESAQLPALRELWRRCLTARADALLTPERVKALGRDQLRAEREEARYALELIDLVEEDLYLDEESAGRVSEASRLAALDALARRKVAGRFGVLSVALTLLALLALGVYQLIQYQQTRALISCVEEASSFDTLYACEDQDHLDRVRAREAYMAQLVKLTQERARWSAREAQRGFERASLLSATALSLRELNLCQVNKRFEEELCERYGCDTPAGVQTRQELTRACDESQRSQRTLDECVSLQEGLDTWEATQDGLKRCASSLTRISYTPCDPAQLRSRCQELAAVMLDELQTRPHSVACRAYVSDVTRYLDSLERAQRSAYAQMSAALRAQSEGQAQDKTQGQAQGTTQAQANPPQDELSERSALNVWLTQVRAQLSESSARCDALAKQEAEVFEQRHAELKPICEPARGELTTLQRAREQRDLFHERSRALCAGEGEREGQVAFCKWSAQCLADLDGRLAHFTQFEDTAKALSEISACQPAYLDAQSFLYDSYALRTRCHELARRSYNAALSATGFKACHAHLEALSDYTLSSVGVDAQVQLAGWLREAQEHCAQVGGTTERLLDLAKTRLSCDHPERVASSYHRGHIAQLTQLSRDHCPEDQALPACRDLKLCQQHYERCQRFAQESQGAIDAADSEPAEVQSRGMNDCARFVAESERLQCSPIVERSPCERALSDQLKLARDSKTSYEGCVQALKALERYPEVLREATHRAQWAKALDHCAAKLSARCQARWSEARAKMTWDADSLRELRRWRDESCDRALISRAELEVEWRALRGLMSARSEVRDLEAQVRATPRQLLCSRVDAINDHVSALVTAADPSAYRSRSSALTRELSRVKLGLEMPFSDTQTFDQHLMGLQSQPTAQLKSQLQSQRDAIMAVQAWLDLHAQACGARADDQRACYQLTIHRVRPLRSDFHFCDDGMIGGVTEVSSTLKRGVYALKRERSQFGFYECKLRSWMSFNEGAGLVYTSSERALVWRDLTLTFTESDTVSDDRDTFKLSFEALSREDLKTPEHRAVASAKRGERLLAEFEVSCALVGPKGELSSCYPPQIPQCN